MKEKMNSRDIAINYLLEEIRCGNLAPGDKIMTERKLSEKLGISRVPIREAISTLSTVGILDARQGDGTFVKDYNLSALSDIVKTYSVLDPFIVEEVFEARTYFEADAAMLAAQNRYEEDIATLEEALREHEAALDEYYSGKITEEEMMQYDEGVHFAIASATHNHFMFQMIQITRDTTVKYQIFSKENTIDNNHFRESAVIHRKIVEAIIDNDSKRAYDLMRQHIINIKKAVDLTLLKKKIKEMI